MNIDLLMGIVSDDEYIKCPHCEYDHGVDQIWEDIDIRDDSQRQEMNCHDCEKEFFVEVMITTKFSSHKSIDDYDDE